MESGSDIRARTSAVISGVGSYLPEQVVTNFDLSQVLETSDPWIRSRTGIRERRRAATGQATSDLAVEAGRRALSASGSDQADTVILATTTPDETCPATAPAIASRLGLEGATAFDVSAVCTGFVYGLAVGAGLIAAGTARRVLVIGADVYSTIINPADRSTAVIFGDGAGAVVLRAGEPGEAGALGPTVLGSDGERGDLIRIPAGGSRQRSTKRSPLPEEQYFSMAGPEVYRQAVARMTEVSQEALRAAGWQIGEVDRLIAHQANSRILDTVSDRLGLAKERQLSNIALVGNTGAASIPLLLDQAVTNGTLRAGHKVVLTAFGGGLTWGATTLIWPRVTSRSAA
ncbi:beta-ketoacyl-ACP synthase III [Promicromonospora panici]|uniref:beta-ketoacyl-ACP synthase III n=1 Tax=Promicromonospora panici TaxID=2219658 RepID=UPI00101BD00F|nr:beta-ketoacyl-ACP synthase III [Promicromonospora panici]